VSINLSCELARLRQTTIRVVDNAGGPAVAATAAGFGVSLVMLLGAIALRRGKDDELP
jgi:hypothetical protein